MFWIILHYGYGGSGWWSTTGIHYYSTVVSYILPF